MDAAGALWYTSTVETPMPPATPATFGDLLRDRARALLLVDERGKPSPKMVAALLAGHGVAATERAVDSWFRSERVPRVRMELVLDALGIRGDARLLAYRLAAKAGRLASAS